MPCLARVRMQQRVGKRVLYWEIGPLLVVVTKEAHATAVSPPTAEDEGVVPCTDQDRMSTIQVTTNRWDDPRVPYPRVLAGNRHWGLRGTG